MEQCELDIILDGTNVRRRVRIPSAALLGDLHVLVQTAMGWNDTAFHSFIIDDEVFGDLEDEDFVEANPEGEHEDDFELSDVFADAERRVTYAYGKWRHNLTLNAMIERDEERPVCVSGQGDCPPDPDAPVVFDLASTNARIDDAFMSIPDYDADADQDAAVWQETELDDMLPLVMDYLDTRGELTDDNARVLRAQLQVLCEAMLSDGQAPELEAAVQRFRSSGATRSQAIDAMVALMSEFPQVLDDEADDAYDDYLAAAEKIKPSDLQKRFPQGTAGAITALAQKIGKAQPK
jgi:hypothetical protein